MSREREKDEEKKNEGQKSHTTHIARPLKYPHLHKLTYAHTLLVNLVFTRTLCRKILTQVLGTLNWGEAKEKECKRKNRREIVVREFPHLHAVELTAPLGLQPTRKLFLRAQYITYTPTPYLQARMSNS